MKTIEEFLKKNINLKRIKDKKMKKYIKSVKRKQKEILQRKELDYTNLKDNITI